MSSGYDFPFKQYPKLDLVDGLVYCFLSFFRQVFSLILRTQYFNMRLHITICSIYLNQYHNSKNKSVCEILEFLFGLFQLMCPYILYLVFLVEMFVSIITVMYSKFCGHRTEFVLHFQLHLIILLGD